MSDAIKRREYRTEYRYRQQLKVAREIITGKRDGMGRAIKAAAPVHGEGGKWFAGCHCPACDTNRTAARDE